MKRLFSIGLIVLLAMQSLLSPALMAAESNGQEITETIITDVTLNKLSSDGGSTELPPGELIEVTEPYEEFKVSLDYQFELPNSHDYGDGDYYHIDVPDMFNVPIISETNAQPLKRADGTTFGTYYTSDNQVVINFNENIENNSDIVGNIQLESSFDDHYSGPADGDEINFPISGGESVDFPIKFFPEASGIEKQANPNKSYNTETIEWTIDFNKGLNTIENAELTDTPTEGYHSFVDGSLKVYELDMNANGDVNGKTEVTDHNFGQEFPLNLGTIDSAYRVVYETEVNDLTGETYKNEATLNGSNIDEMKTDSTVSVVRGEPLEKEAINYDNSSQTITWEVKYNYDEKDVTQENAKLHDQFGANQELIEDSFEVQQIDINQNTGEEMAENQVDSSEYTINPNSEGFDFEFNNNINQAYKVTYQTTATERVFDDMDIQNTISDEFNHEESGNQSINQGIFIKSHEAANYDSKETGWSVLINRDSYTMEDVTFTDTLPQGFTPKDVNVTHGGDAWSDGSEYTYSYDESTREIQIEFNQAIDQQVMIDYTTAIDFDEATQAPYTNDALLEWTREGVSHTKEGSAIFNPDQYTQNNGFKHASYNMDTKEITWTVGVNYNLETLNNVVVNDYILGDQNFNIDNVNVYEMTLTGGENGYELGDNVTDANISSSENSNGDQGFEVALGDINSGYVIQYSTDLNDQLIQNEYLNEAEVESDNKETITLDSSLSPDYGGEYSNKEASQNSENPRVVNWNVNINFTQSTVTNLTVTDTPSLNQQLLKDSIKIYETNVTESEINKSDNTLNEGEDYTIEFTENDNGQETFTVDFGEGEINRPYVLEYDTYILYEGNGNLANNFTFNANETSDIDTGDQYSQAIDLSSISGSISGEVGSLQVEKVANDDPETTLAGAEFELYDESGDVLLQTETTNENGIVTFDNLLYGDYVLKEAKAPEGYVAGIESEEQVTVDAETTQHQVSNKEIKRHVELTKVDGFNGNPLSGVEFELRDDNNNVEGTYTTEQDGMISIQDLDPGNYHFVETQPAQDYQDNTTEYDFTIEEKQTEIDEITVENDLIPGSATTTKVDADNLSDGLEGAEFEVQRSPDGEVVKTITSDAEGVVDTGDLRPGDYQLVETAAPKGFNLLGNDPIDFTIDRSQDQPADIGTGAIENEVKTTAIELTKTDSVNGQSLAGATFELNYGSGNYSAATQTATTNENGKVTFNNLKPGTYQVTETASPEGYIANSGPIEIDVTLDDVHNGTTVTQEVQNDPYTDVQLTKVDAETGYKLSGAEFDVINAVNDSSVEGFTGLTTDENGALSITGLPTGDYYLKEVQAPNGYKISGDGKTEVFTISDNSTTETIDLGEINNEIIKGSVELTKVDGDTDELLEAVEFSLKATSLDNDGTYTETTHITNENGVITVQDLRPGTYEFTETSPPDGYQPYWGDITFDIEFGSNQQVQLDIQNYQLVDFEANKNWIDNNDEQSLRPDSIMVNLMQNGEKVDEVEMTSADDWTYLFTGLDAVDSNGDKYTYSVKEQNVEDYQLANDIEGNVEDGFTITNELKRSIDMTKNWLDDGDRLGNRPDTVTINLLQDNNQFRTVDLTSDWQHTFDNLPVYDESGQEYNYTLEEVDPGNDYVLNNKSGNMNDGFTIENLLTNTKDISVTKEWVDQEDTADRPDEITLNLYQKLHSDEDYPEEAYKTADVSPNASDEWAHQFEGLPQFNEEGVEYNYQVEEAPVTGYDSNKERDGDTVTITNTRADTTSIEGTKTWRDDNSEERPESITVQLTRKNDSDFLKEKTVSAGDNWYYEFTDLSAYNNNGERYQYQIDEVDVEGYDKEIDGYDLTNTREGSLTIEGSKTWVDTPETADRPEEIEVILKRGTEEINRQTVSGDDWSYQFENLPEFDDRGVAYDYTINEDTVDGYETTVDGYDLTNTRYEQTSINVEKVWNDQQDATNDRPSEITVELYRNGGGDPYKTATLSSENDWQTTFEQLEVYDDEGAKYTYVIEEQAVEGYQSTKSEDGDTVTFTNTRTGTTDINVSKKWNDQESSDARPNEISVSLFREGKEESIVQAKINKDNDWQYTFSGIERFNEQGEKYQFYVEEQAVDGYNQQNITGDHMNGFTITNVSKTSVTVDKEWLDEEGSQNRPNQIEVNLYQNGESMDKAQLSSADDWSYTFDGLDAYDPSGKKYNYEIKEVSTGEGYELKGINEDEDHQFTVENVRVGTTSVEGSKSWEDDDKADRPESISINLLQNGTVDEIKKVTADNNWKYQFKNLDQFDENGKPYDYEVSEQEVPGYQSEVEEGTFDITNTRSEQRSIIINKGWNDSNPEDRPSAIQVDLLQNGNLHKEIEITAEDNWTKEVTDLPAYDSDGQAIEYSIEEHDVEGYDSNVKGFDITNTRVGTTTVEGTKTWVDGDASERPETITVNLLQNGEKIKSKPVTSDMDWQYQFKGLDVYDSDGQPYEYTVEEEAVTGYEAIYDEDSYDITNVRSEDINIDVTKTWLDHDSSSRPDSIQVQLLQNGESFREGTVKASDGWVYEFTDVPRFNSDGEEYKYTLSESKVEGYESSVDGFDITNLRTGTTEVSGTKTWKDDQSADRPDSITVNLLKNEEQVDQQTVTSKNGWTYKFEELEAFNKDGIPHDYTVEEDPIEGYETNIEGYDITNTRVGKTSVEGQKTWLDGNANNRPDAIKIHLLKNGEQIKTQEVTADSSWQYTFKELEKYDDEGKLYNYSIEEKAIEGYHPMYDQFDITNRRVGVTSIDVTKSWEQDAESVRPNSILVSLYQNGELFREATLTASDDWQYTFKDLPEYDQEGKRFDYTIKEKPVDGYSSQVDGNHIINTYEESIPSSGENDEGNNQDDSNETEDTLPQTSSVFEWKYVVIGLTLLIGGTWLLRRNKMSEDKG
ncbi:Cna B-type domain-containing protein [Alkalibacillus sp. S2W]|uniref:Cna B-type domain-containing protein n=1 Tax=Alkalibacillus sp. S2W TaxID=3386553 RepID=UPI00398D33F5